MPTPRAARALRRAAAAAVLVVLALAATAPAATLSESLNGGLNYTAAFGERNDLKLRQTGDLVIVEDIVPIRESHPRCITTSSGAIGCSRLPIGATARVQLLDGDDVFTGAALVPTEVIAGGGNDRYVAGRAPGISRVSFDAGADTGDVVDFSTANGPSVLHAEDVVANDGRGFDKDLVKGVERVVGSPFGDTLIGSEAGETFAPGGGDDTVETRGGADLVDMGSVRDGADRIVGDVADVVSYRLRTQPLLVSVSEGTRNDGEAFEDDDIVGVGSVRAGEGERRAGRRAAGARRLDGARGRLRRRHARRGRGRGPAEPGAGRRRRAGRGGGGHRPLLRRRCRRRRLRRGRRHGHRRRAGAGDRRLRARQRLQRPPSGRARGRRRQADPHPAGRGRRRGRGDHARRRLGAPDELAEAAPPRRDGARGARGHRPPGPDARARPGPPARAALRHLRLGPARPPRHRRVGRPRGPRRLRPLRPLRPADRLRPRVLRRGRRVRARAASRRCRPARRSSRSRSSAARRASTPSACRCTRPAPTPSRCSRRSR